MWCQPCSWILPESPGDASWCFSVHCSPARHCGWSFTCYLPCYRIDCRGHVNLLSGTVLHWHGEHEVASKTAFFYSHSRDLIVIPSEGTVFLPRCKISGMQTDVGTLYGRHKCCTWPCRERGERKLQHEDAELASIALTQLFTAYSDELERVEVFKDLNWLLPCNNNTTQADWVNLRKACKCKSWG